MALIITKRGLYRTTLNIVPILNGTALSFIAYERLDKGDNAFIPAPRHSDGRPILITIPIESLIRIDPTG